MKLLFKRFFFFISLSFVIILALTLCLHFILKKAYQPSSYRFKNVETIITGDSHTHCALDPKYINNSRNFSFHSEPYFATYYKIKLLLDNNPGIKTLVLAVGIHNFAKEGDESLIANNQDVVFYDRYNRIIDFSEIHSKKDLKYYVALLERFGYPSKNNVKIAFKILTNHFKQNDLPFWGYFTKRTQQRLSQEVVTRILKRHYGDNLDRSLRDSTDEDFRTLHKICDLAISRGVKVYLFASPVSSYYYNGIPAKFKDAFHTYMHNMEVSSPGIKFLDYTQYPLSDSCYIDADHLNFNGAKLISTELNNRINLSSENINFQHN